MRLIDADALIMSLDKRHEHWHEIVSSENKEIEYAHQYAVNVIRNAPTAEPTGDLIRREDAIKAVTIAVLADKDEIEALEALPSAEGGDADMTVIPEGTGLMQPCPDNGADLISRADAIEAVKETLSGNVYWDYVCDAVSSLSALPSADAEPKWNCTANFVAEQLERLKDMTDEERIKLLHILFPSAEAEPSLKAIKRQIDEHWYLDPPSAEAVQGWIPCSERLPSEKDDRVLVTKRGKVRIATYSEFDGTWYVGEMCAVGGEDPIAWMPLPKPYKGGDDK